MAISVVQDDRPTEPDILHIVVTMMQSVYAGPLIEMISQLHLILIFASIALHGLHAIVAEGQTGLQRMHLGEQHFLSNLLCIFHAFVDQMLYGLIEALDGSHLTAVASRGL